MLDGLGKIDWRRLRHAYGAAADVPDLLRALDASDGGARDMAATKLAQALAHQGTLYSASPKAVPFVIELLANGAHADRARLLRLLVDLVFGSTDGGLASTSIAARFGARDGKWAKASYKAARAGLDAVRAWLDDGSPAVRAATAYVLGWFPDDAVALAPALRARLVGEGDATVRASLLLALGRADAALGDGADDGRFEAALAAPDLAERVAGAAALSYRRGDDLPAAALDVLAVAARSGGHPDRPWDDGDLARLATRILAALGLRHADAVVCAMLAAVPARPRTILALLPRAFPERCSPGQPLSPLQRATLEAIAKDERVLFQIGELREALATRGLPNGPAEIAALAGVAREPEPLDRPLDVEAGGKVERLRAGDALDRVGKGDSALGPGVRAALAWQPPAVRWATFVAACAHWSSARPLDEVLLGALADLQRDDPAAFAKHLDEVATGGPPSVLVNTYYVQPGLVLGFLAAVSFDVATARGAPLDPRLDAFAQKVLAIAPLPWLVERFARLPPDRLRALVAGLEKERATAAVKALLG